MAGLVVGGVYQLYQGDLDLGRVALERLEAEDLGPVAVLEDLSYGAVAVVQRLEELAPDRVVLVAAEQRGREPGAVERRRVVPSRMAPDEAASAVRQAVTGYVTVDLVVDVAFALTALPPTVAVEVEPASVEPGEGLSAAALRGLETALDVVRAEARRYPILDLAARIRSGSPERRLRPSPVLAVLVSLLDEIEAVDTTGVWGRTFPLVEELRLALAADGAPEGMDKLDWALWWALVEEGARLQGVEAVG